MVVLAELHVLLLAFDENAFEGVEELVDERFLVEGSFFFVERFRDVEEAVA